ncbi:LysR family transcriptional regulator [Vibrio sp. SS-MA-C1-2]|uniref:LysR family transcriptional regulator n=1 Tax=Vibrio sp. SS-MA-C1-2 TaxID=2908646 RepID=UPI001F39DF0F|nr:LysR family transcriptional regulator [Vibrio sp. SS-MA-C1-2]UJF19319.1 LysR family transcriptional regulator [Vibrio sp. SS-MA-C1-2]
MDIEEVYRKDLNLLVALKVLLEENSVTAAAYRLNLSQSAMSRVLSRLRTLLSDPIFTRQGSQLVPTEKALLLSQQLNEPLEALRTLLTPNTFAPESCEDFFTIAASDYAIQTILPIALKEIYQQAPHISLRFIPLQQERMLEQLTHDKVDMAVCHPIGDISPLQRLSLGEVGVLCLVAKDHPLVDEPITIESYLSLPQAMIAISDGVKQQIDNHFLDQKPRLMLRASYLEAAMALVDKMPLIITVPADLAYLYAERYQLVIKALPIDFKPFDYSLLWHPRSEHSAPHIWLRELIQKLCSEMIEQGRY